jgi:hypothetical protein
MPSPELHNLCLQLALRNTIPLEDLPLDEGLDERQKSP